MIIDMARSREILPELMKRACQDAIRRVKSLLYSVSMVDVYVNIENTGMVPARGRYVSALLRREGLHAPSIDVPEEFQNG